jgi:cell division protease FtsH
MNRTRRYLRWLKRALIIYGVYLLIGMLLFGANPGQLTAHPGATFAEYRPMLVQFVFLFFVLIIQFVGMFWFLARGTYYTVYPNEYDHTFDDVRGQPAAVRSTKEVLRLFMGFKNFREMGGYPPHGILFEGPPGTGKTLMAKAIAGHAQVPILVADGSRFMSMFFGIGNIKVRRMFSRARAMSDKYGGAVIFIDELDALGGSRGGVSQRMDAAQKEDRPPRIIMGAGMGGGAGMGVINELLVGLDGFVQPRGLMRHVRRLFRLGKPRVPFYNILIIGATNRARTLDPALLRPGRFDRKIHVGLPDHEGRQDIAHYYLAKVRHEPLDVAKLARMTQGYSPAAIKNVVNEALIFALQDGRDALRWDDLWQAKLVEEIGLKQPVKLTPREKEMVAVHEAAHAVASYTLERGERVIQVITIQKREGALGLVHGQSVEDLYTESQRQILARIQVFLAGHAAEELWFEQLTSGSGSDLQVATFLASAYVGFNGMGKSLISVGAAMDPLSDANPVKLVLSDEGRKQEVDELLASCRRQVLELLKQKRHVVEGIRDALLDREELIGDEIEEVMAQLGEREPLPVRAGDVAAGQRPGDPQGGNGPTGQGNGPSGPLPGGIPPPPGPPPGGNGGGDGHGNGPPAPPSGGSPPR